MVHISNCGDMFLRHTDFKSQQCHLSFFLLQNRNVTYNHNVYTKTKIHFTAVYNRNCCEMCIHVITVCYIYRGEKYNIYLSKSSLIQDRTQSSLSKWNSNTFSRLILTPWTVAYHFFTKFQHIFFISYSLRKGTTETHFFHFLITFQVHETFPHFRLLLLLFLLIYVV